MSTFDSRKDNFVGLIFNKIEKSLVFDFYEKVI